MRRIQQRIRSRPRSGPSEGPFPGGRRSYTPATTTPRPATTLTGTPTRVRIRHDRTYTVTVTILEHIHSRQFCVTDAHRPGRAHAIQIGYARASNYEVFTPCDIEMYAAAASGLTAARSSRSGHPEGCKYRNLAEPGPERQNGRVYSAGFFEDRWRRYPHPSLSRGLLAGGGGSGRLGRSSPGRGGVPCRPD
jgi:hypothetical protein